MKLTVMVDIVYLVYFCLFVSVYREENKLMNSRVNMDIEVDMCCDRHGKLMFRIHFK